jgi:hypothetical protein
MKRRIISDTSFLTLAVVLCLSLLIVTWAQPAAPLGEPLEERAPGSSLMLLSTDTTLQVVDEVLALTPPEEIAPLDEASQPPRDTNTDTLGSTTPESDGAGTGENPNEQTVPSTGDESEVIKTGVVYFTTSIRDGETLSRRDYSFTVNQTAAVEEEQLQFRYLEVSLGGDIIPQFNGNLLLDDGENHLQVFCYYLQADGYTRKVSSKVYTLYVDRYSLVLNTNLQNKSVYSSSISFTAQAFVGSDEMPVTATVNGAAVSGSRGNYTVGLAQGDNMIILVASQGEQVVERSFLVICEQNWVETDLFDQTVSDTEFRFFARLKSGVSSTARLTVVFNGRTLSSTDGNFTVTLVEQSSNTIRISVSDLTQTPPSDVVYRIKHRRALAGEDDDITAQSPTFTVNITDGQTVVGSDFTFEVIATDYRGNRIYSSGARGAGITLTLNESQVHASWEGSRTSYALRLSPGANSIMVLVVDTEGYSTRRTFTLNCEQVGIGEPIGYVTLSIDANVVGLGTLISSAVEPIYEGENAVYPIARVLNANGFEYQYTGSADSQFYLAHLIRPNITKRNNLSLAAIPPELLAYLEADGIALNDFYTDSLGERDFSQGSGWMISINGVYPSYSLSDYRPKDEDAIRVRYTVAYGKDIAGGYPQQW